MQSTRADDLREFLVAVYAHKLADPGKPFSVPFHRGSSVRACLNNSTPTHLHTLNTYLHPFAINAKYYVLAFLF